MKRGACGCRNHLGKQKPKYPSIDAAMARIINYHMKFGPHEVYPCPKMDGVFHIKSKRTKVS